MTAAKRFLVMYPGTESHIYDADDAKAAGVKHCHRNGLGLSAMSLRSFRIKQVHIPKRKAGDLYHSDNLGCAIVMASDIQATSDGAPISDDGWCEGKCGQGFDNAIYYEYPETGRHGWGCGKCRRITQTG